MADILFNAYDLVFVDGVWSPGSNSQTPRERNFCSLLPRPRPMFPICILLSRNEYFLLWTLEGGFFSPENPREILTL